MAAMASPLAARAYTAGGLSVGNRRSKLRCRQTMNVRAAIADAEESAVFRAWDSATSSNKRTDLQKIMILGAGPIVIGQVRSAEPRVNKMSFQANVIVDCCKEEKHAVS